MIYILWEDIILLIIYHKYDQPNKTLHQKIETIQHNAPLAITGSIKSTSSIKLYNELGLESLEFRRWFRKLCLFF